jgi:hypothetical protein
LVEQTVAQRLGSVLKRFLQSGRLGPATGGNHGQYAGEQGLTGTKAWAHEMAFPPQSAGGVQI